ncbi:MAG: hypothetical protein ABSF50_09525 [Burkholderiaceae bacterium]|jgi:hypothetical protein
MITNIQLRQWHSYIGMLVAPSVLFFSITGSLQIFDLHEEHDGYKPPILLEKLGHLHKDQVLSKPEGSHESDHHSSAGEANEASGQVTEKPEEHHAEAEPSTATMILKWYFACIAVVLAVSTLMGIWIGLSRRDRRSVSIFLLLLGVILPGLLLLL